MVLYPSPEEAAVAEPEAKRAASIHAYVYDDFEADRVPPKTPEILFVAGFAHSPNVDAAVWLVGEIFPLILARAPDATLALVGANPTEQVRALASDRVKVTGRVSEEELRASYLRARIAIVPLRFGAGVKSKVAEALREGLPLVTTTVGAQGLTGIEKSASVVDDPRAIADAAGFGSWKTTFSGGKRQSSKSNMRDSTFRAPHSIELSSPQSKKSLSSL